jgi:hypothetical protein
VHSRGTVDVILGRYQARRHACRLCGATWTSYEEKETDVNIAVSLLPETVTGPAGQVYKRPGKWR